MSFGPLAQVTCVRNGAFAISGPGGDLCPGGDQGFYVRDTRFLDRVEVTVDGAHPAPLVGGAVGADRALFHAFLPPRDDLGPDATTMVTRRRAIEGGLHEHVELANAGTEAETLRVEVGLGTDFAYIFDVKHHRRLEPVAGVARGATVVFDRAEGVEQTVAALTVDGDDGPVEAAGGTGAALAVPLHLAPGQRRTLCLRVSVRDVFGTVSVERSCDRFWTEDAPRVALPPQAGIRCSDRRFSRLVRRSLRDLDGLTMTDEAQSDDRFLAAGSPWYLTLFGRDSLWSALMALPFDPGLAVGTLHTLARRQGTRFDPDTEEAPGKILHEVRRGALAQSGDLPPSYYGTVDATPLFVLLAHEAWRWGVAEPVLEELMPNVERALGWLRRACAEDADGFLRYARVGRRGLANQGWKDSGDGIRFADGTIARAPMALAEVQGYAHAAARRGAELLDHFGRDGGDGWRLWAKELAEAFRRRFWVDATEPYPAVALDFEGRAVDSVASNMGHLPFTGILTDEEVARVAARLRDPTMDSGWGLRTLSTANGGFNPLSYHCGSVWPHDTAIAAWSLGQAGWGEVAASLLEGLLAAAPTFNHRLPELFAGVARDGSIRPVPYPTACRPQAWAAGSALLLVRTVLGLEADVPRRRLTVRPLDPPPFERLVVSGIHLGQARVEVELRGGELDVRTDDPDLTVDHG